MAKNDSVKTKVKKPRRRMKKQVRKTIGGLFLASAIVVASIPTPEVSANVTTSEHNKILVKSGTHTTYNNNPANADRTYDSTVPFVNDITDASREAEKIVYTSENGLFQFVYMRPTPTNPNRVAVILGYTGAETSLTIPDTLEGYRKYRDNDTSSGYCLVSKNNEFLAYQTTKQKEVAKVKFYLVEDILDPVSGDRKEVDENQCVFRVVEGEQQLVYVTNETRTVTPTPDPAADPADPVPTPYDETYEVIHRITPEMIVTYEPCYNTTKSEWENIPEADLYYTTDRSNFTLCGNEADHQRINADVAFIGQEKLEADPTTGGWMVGDPIVNPDEGVFANNASLTNLTMGKNIQGIGDFAFYNCSTLSSLDFGPRLETVGNGAFADCIRLSSCVLAPNANLLALGKDAFNNCRSLQTFATNVGLLAIGDSCFEDCTGLTNIYLCGEEIGGGEMALKYIGNHVFRGCTNLTKIEFPYTYGQYDVMPLELDMIEGCTSLQTIKINNDVVDFDIYHKDGEYEKGKSASAPAFPRCNSDWDDILSQLPDSFYIEAPDISAAHETCKEQSIAFKYLNSEPELYEIKLFEEAKTGTSPDPAEITYQIHTDGSIYKVIINGDPVNLTIPEKIGPYGIDTIGEGAFTNNCALTKVTIPESCKTIDSNAFKGCHNLKVVSFTDATKVENIGEGAFDTQDCLYKVTGSGSSKTITCSDCYETLNLGTNTDPVKLTFCGAMIDSSTNQDTVPFAFAMNGQSNTNNKDQGISWITYHSGWPTNLEVMYDYNAVSGEGIVKLVNYPRFSDYESVTSVTSDYLLSLPYVTTTGAGKNDEYYFDLISSAVSAYQSYILHPESASPPTSAQMELINSALNIVVPSNVDAIKTGIFSGVDATGAPVSPAIAANTELQTITLNGVEEIEPYTFAGNTELREASIIGPTYIGDYCFDKDTKLQSVTLGTGLDDTGLRPFSGCTNLDTINCLGDNFSYKDGLLFRNLGSSDELVECLEGRGGAFGSYTISGGELSNVSKIKEEAFMNCTNVGKVDLSKASIDVLPRSCFNHATNLNSVELGSGLTQIMEESFWDTTELRTITLPYSITMIAQDAFANNEEGSKTPSGSFHDTSHKFNPVIVSCVEGSIADKYAKAYDYLRPEYGAVFITHNVYFYDDFDDATKPKLLSKQIVNDGEDAVPPTPNPDHTADGYEFTGWSNYKAISRDTDVYAKYKPIGDPDFTIIFMCGECGEILDTQIVGYDKNATPPKYHDHSSEGRIFKEWVGKYLGVRADGTVVAKYVGQSEGDTHTVKFFADGNLVSTQFIADGAAATAPMPPEKSGYKFVRWTPSTFNEVKEDMTVVAEYEKIVNPVPQPTSSAKPTGATPTPTSNNNNNGNKSEEKKYTVTVSGGSGTGSYPAGAIVAVNAYDMGTGQTFDKWTSSTAGVGFAMPNSPSTYFVMPANNVAVTATYKTGGGSNSTGGNSGNGGSGNNGSSSSSNKNTGSSIDISKSGISHTNVAGASVSGSSDNFIVKVTDDQTAADLSLTALQNAFGDISRIKYLPMDISLYDSTGRTKIADTSGLSVAITMPLPDELASYAGNNKVASVRNGQLENLNSRFTTVDGVPCISFTATHFSPYVIYVDTANLTESTIDYTPKTGDPIHPKWFLAIGLAAISMIFFFKKDKKVKAKAA